MCNRAREDGIGMHDNMNDIRGTAVRDGVMAELEEARLEEL